MELDEMKAAWIALDRRLQRQETLNFGTFREARLDRLRGTLRGAMTGLTAQIAFGVLMTLVFAPFWVAHRATPHLFLTGLSLHGYGILMIVLAARDLYLIARVDYAAPVLDIQRRLTEFRAWRV